MRCDRAAGNGEEHGPSIEKCGQRTKAFADEDVEASSFGTHGGEFAVAECSKQRQNAARDPDQRGHTDGMVHLTENSAWDKENAGANNRANDKEDQVAKAESTNELGHWEGVARES